ncbi:MATE family efflux transporter [Thiothrix eikelboomii]|uniref:MATE family efflux transporter n=1 Tax=Thiothrix eikelboomii TaxID=92487 RepID=UPI003BAF5D0A
MLKRDLTVGDEKQILISQTLPMLWGLIAVMSVTIVDTYYLGLLGTHALAAMGFVFPVVMFMNSLSFGIGVGASSVIARAIGSKQEDWVRNYSTQALVLALIVSLLFAMVGLLTVDPLFRLLGAPDDLLPYIHQYMDTWYWGCFLIVVPMVGNACLRAAGNTKIPSYTMTAIAVINLIIAPVLIFGLFGLPRLELQGAAIASIVAYFSAMVVTLYVLYVKLHFITLKALTSQIGQSWKDILHLAVPASGTNLISPISIAITTRLIATYGSEAVAGYSVASRIEMFGLMLVMALASTLAPFAGQNWGAQKIERLRRALRLSFVFVWGWGLAMAVLFWLAAVPLTQLFTQHEAAVQASVTYLHIVPITYGLLSTIMIVSSMANGIGQALPALVMTVSRLLVIYLPLAWLLAQQWGLNGIYIATAAANALVGFGAWYWSTHACNKREAAISVPA